MTMVKLCGLSRECDIEAANELLPDFIGFVFAKKSPRYVSFDRAKELKSMLSPNIKSVGVFVNEAPENIVKLLDDGVIDIAQLHGSEDEEYISRLRALTEKPIIRAFVIKDDSGIEAANACSADFVLLDSGAGTGNVFDWALIKKITRPYFLAGGLDTENVGEAVRLLHPHAVDVSSGIETDGFKDKTKMAVFTAAVRKED